MNFKEYKLAFTKKALSSRLSVDYVDKCLIYAERLSERSLPVIYDIDHLSALVGYNRHYLERAVVFTNYFYRVFEVKKNNGGMRKISEPLPSLKEIQVWILENILYQVKPSRFAKAYVRGTSLKQNIIFHKSQKVVLGLDLKNFFSNVKREQVEKIFNEFGYSKAISNLLSKLCTLNDRLPQGAPTSPAISNLAMLGFDDAISTYALEQKYRYTRYADDITLSGEIDIDEAISKIKEELNGSGQELNLDKVRIMRQGMRQTVTGVVVNKSIQVSKVQRKQLRQTVHYIKKFGLSDHMKKIENSHSNYILHLLGKIDFVLFINPDDHEFRSYKAFLQELT